MITRITITMQNILNISYSRESNCSSDDDNSNNEVIDLETGVAEVADVSTNPDESVVQPPDELVAKEVFLSTMTKIRVNQRHRQVPVPVPRQGSIYRNHETRDTHQLNNRGMIFTRAWLRYLMLKIRKMKRRKMR